MRHNGFWPYVLATAAILAISSVPTQAEHALRWGHIRVMTQNMYVGADLAELREAVNFDQIPGLAAALLLKIEASDFQARAAAFAREVERERPHLIGLQEMVRIRTQCPGDAALGGVEPAEDLYADYVEMLIQALAERGLNYRVAAAVENADVESPALAIVGNMAVLPDCTSGFPIPEQPLFDLRITDRDVILARADVFTDEEVKTNYATNLVLDTVGGPIEFTRGIVAVDAHLHSRVYRFVTTHLEVRGGGDPVLAAVRFAQASELVELLDAAEGTLIVVGDFNSAEEDGPWAECAVAPTTTFSCPTPYRLMQEAEFTDVWKERRGAKRRGAWASGDTCCQDEDLSNDVSALDRRIDLIWVRAAPGDRWERGLRAVQANTIGDEQSDRTANGLWYSDHAGVSAEMAVLAPRDKQKPRWRRKQR